MTPYYLIDIACWLINSWRGNYYVVSIPKQTFSLEIFFEPNSKEFYNKKLHTRDVLIHCHIRPVKQYTKDCKATKTDMNLCVLYNYMYVTN